MFRSYRHLMVVLFVAGLLALALPVFAIPVYESFDSYALGTTQGGLATVNATYASSGKWEVVKAGDFALMNTQALQLTTCNDALYITLAGASTATRVTYAYPDKSKGFTITAWQGIPGQGGTLVFSQTFYGDSYNVGLNWYEGVAEFRSVKEFNYVTMGSHSSCAAIDDLRFD